MTTFWQRVEADGQKALAWCEGFLKNTVVEEVAALAPIALQEVAAVVGDIGALSSPAGIAAVAASAFPGVLKQIESKSLQVAGSSIIAAIGSAVEHLASASSLLPAPAPAKPQPQQGPASS